MSSEESKDFKKKAENFFKEELGVTLEVKDVVKIGTKACKIEMVSFQDKQTVWKT